MRPRDPIFHGLGIESLIFSKFDENTVQGMLLKPPDKPVLAREREARFKGERFLQFVQTCSQQDRGRERTKDRRRNKRTKKDKQQETHKEGKKLRTTKRNTERGKGKMIKGKRE